ncbi:MAG: preprotein translocase subunit SecE, partial [Candidatus Aquicultor primus]
MAEKKPAKAKGSGSAKKFFKDVRFELGKVIWPGREEIAASTVVVLAAMAFFAVF